MLHLRILSIPHGIECRIERTITFHLFREVIMLKKENVNHIADLV